MWQRLHADLAGAELVELPPGAALPLACHIVLMRGTATVTAVDHASVSCRTMASSDHGFSWSMHNLQQSC